MSRSFRKANDTIQSGSEDLRIRADNGVNPSSTAGKNEMK